jgi:uncharacterized membrane protein YgdD (TMEM256/DUF423 family)
MSTDRQLGRRWVMLGALNGFLAVALGAFAAHGLKGALSARMLEIFEKGVDYQGFHALALLGTGLLSLLLPPALWLHRAAVAFLVGIALFSGSLYLLAVTGIGAWGAVTPFGGLSFLLGWAFLAWGVLRDD